MSEKSNSNEKYAVCAKSLKKRYGDTKALDGVSFSAETGQVFSLLGVNGAGKTTAVRVLCGLIKPDEGESTICSFPSCDERAKYLIGVSPQETSTAGNLTVEENLIMTAEIYGVKKPAEKTKEITDALGLGEYSGRLSKNLSGGLRRRLSIGMALVSSPRVLFLDEPTLGLDVLARRELWSLINSLRSSMTVILTTHYMEEAERLSDRIAVMAAGKIIAEGSLDELRELSRLSSSASLEEVFVSIAGGQNEI